MYIVHDSTGYVIVIKLHKSKLQKILQLQTTEPIIYRS